MVISNSLGVVTSDVATVSVVVPTAPAVAGPLYVNLQASDLSAGSAVWGNQGSLGSFNAIGVPSRVTNVLATGLPGVMFSGTNAYGGPPAPADLTGGSDRSVEVWALNPSIGDEEGLVSWGHRGFGPQSFGISYGNNLVYGAVSDWLGNIGWGSADRVPAAGLWHHFVFTYNSNAVGTVYVDGAFVTNKLYTTPLNTFPAEAISIACQRDPDTNTLAMTFSGYINSVRIHGGALSAQQVATNYAFGPARLLTNGPMLSMAWIPAGTFTMGSPLTETNRYYWESPQTQVTLTRGFWIGKYEVTQPEYQAVTGSNPSANVGTNLPVDSVSWIQATNYCALLTAAEQAAGRLPAGYVYRLPTGAEWEYACRAGRTNRFSYGDDFGFVQLPQYAWFSANSGYETHPVGSLLPNPWSLFDMYGNVNEWCWDWHATSYPGGSVTDPKGPTTGTTRQIRGGDYSTDGPWCRSASRADASPSDGVSNVGFRVVLGAPL